MKTLMLSLATALVLSINSTASAWVVHAGPVTVAGRPAVVRRPVPVVRPVVRPAVVHHRREVAERAARVSAAAAPGAPAPAPAAASFDAAVIEAVQRQAAGK